jgi:hypothetical protein
MIATPLFTRQTQDIQRTAFIIDLNQMREMPSKLAPAQKALWRY